MGHTKAYGEILKEHWMALVILIYTFLFSIFIVGLWGFHNFLILNSLTTHEFAKS